MTLSLINSRKRRLINLLLKFLGIRIRNVLLGRASVFACKCIIGYGTRLNSNFFCRGKGTVSIGRYCAFGHNIRIITSNHPYTYANLQYDLQKKIVGNLNSIVPKDVIIGNNVWIGDNVIILPGVHIGNGAIVGAGAVVTKEVEAYCIVAGNPAKKIRARFDKDVQLELEKMCWWNWSEEKMLSNKSFFDAPLEK